MGKEKETGSGEVGLEFNSEKQVVSRRPPREQAGVSHRDGGWGEHPRQNQ